MDWMQILREFGIPTLYAVVLLIYFIKTQDFLRKDLKSDIEKIGDGMVKIATELSITNQKTKETIDLIIKILSNGKEDIK